MSEFFRATPPGILSDEDAGFLSANIGSVPQAARFKVAAKINEYANFRKHYPRPLTPEEQQAQRTERLRLNDIFSDFDKATAGEDFPTVALAEPAQKQQAQRDLSNRAFLQHFTGQDSQRLERDYDLTRDAVAKQMFGGAGVGDDGAFYGAAAGYLQDEKAKDELTDSLAAAATRAALWDGSGLADPLRPTLRSWQEAQQGKPGFKPDFDGHYNRTWSQVAGQTRAEVERVRPYLDDVWAVLTDDREQDDNEVAGVDIAGLLDRLMELPRKDQNLVLGLVRERAQMIPEDQQEGWWARAARTFGRQWDEVATGNLEAARMLQGNLPDEAGGGDASRRQTLFENLRNLRNNEIAPIEQGGLLSRTGLSLAASLPGMIVALGVHPYLLVGSFAADGRETLRTMLQEGGMGEDEAADYSNGLALPAGIAMARIEQLTLGMAKSLPGIRQLQAKLLSTVASSAVKRGAARAGAVVLEGIEQQAQEVLQDSTAPLMAEMARMLGSDKPDIEAWAPGIATLKDPSAWGVAMVFGVMGLGRLPDLQAAKALTDIGVDQAGVERILRAPDQAAFMTATLEELQKARPQDTTTDAADNELANRGAGVASITRAKDGWWLNHDDGTRTSVDSAGAALALRDDLEQVNTQEEADALVQIADWWGGKNPRSSQTFTGEMVTTQGDGTAFTSRRGGPESLVPLTEASGRELAREYELAEQADGGTGVARLVYGSNAVAWQQSIVGNAAVVVESLNTKTNVTGTVLTQIHEQVEVVWKAGMANGTFTREESLRAMRKLEEAIGRRLIQSADPDDTELREAISEAAQADAFGRRKDGTRTPAGAITRGINAAINASTDPTETNTLGKFRAFFRAIRRHWSNVFRLTASMAKARRDGKLKEGDDYDAFMRKLFQLDEQQGHEEAVAKELGVDAETFAVQVNVAPVRVDSLSKMNSQEMAKRATSAKTIHLRAIINDTAAAYGVPIQQMEPVIGGWTEDGRVSLEVPQAVLFDTEDFDLAQEMAAVVAVSAPDLQNGAFVWEPDPEGPGVMVRFKAKNPEEVARLLQDGGVQGFSYDPGTREFSIAFFDKTDTVSLEHFDEFIRSQQAAGNLPRLGSSDQAGGGIARTAGKFGLPSEGEYGAYLGAARRRADQSTGEQKERLDYVVSRAERRFQRYLAAKQIATQASAKLATTRRPASAAAAIEQELKGRQFANIRELGLWIDKRFERKYGVPRFGIFKATRGTTAFGGFTDQEMKQAGDALAYDVLDGLATDGSGMGWYDERVAETLREFVRLYPELGSNPMEFAVFIGILASTSQGFTVVQNFKHADAVWARFKKDGRLPQDMIFAKATDPINSNFRQMQELIDEFGLHGFAQFMDEEITGMALRDLYGMQPTGVTQSEVVRGNRILGPKIGSFFNNLRGRFDTITMDLWYTRTMHRYVGETVVPLDSPRTQQLLVRFREAFAKSPRTYGLKAEDFTGDEATVRAALTVFTRWSRGQNEYTEKGYYKFPDGYKIEKAARGIFATAGMKGAPQNKAYRTAFAQIVKAGKAKLKKMGFDLSEADIQAIVWYREKNLFARTGVANASAKPADYVDAVMVLRESKAGSAAIVDESAEEEALAEQEEAEVDAADETFSVGRRIDLASFDESTLRPAANAMDAERRLADGKTVYALSEMDETLVMITSQDMLDSYRASELYWTDEPLQGDDTFALSSATGLERLARQLQNRAGSPIAKLRAWQAMAGDLAGMARAIRYNDEGVTSAAIVQIHERGRKAGWDAARIQAEVDKAIAANPRVQEQDGRRALVILDRMLAQLPAEVRARVGGFTRLADLQTNKARFAYFSDRIQRIDQEMERHLRGEYLTELNTVFRDGRARAIVGERDRGKLGANAHAWLVEAERISMLPEMELQAEEALVDGWVNGGAPVDDAVIAHYARLYDTVTDETSARLAIEGHEALLNLFGAIRHRRVTGTDKNGQPIFGEPVRNAGEIFAALEAAQEVVDTGRMDWLQQMIARRDRRAAQRDQAAADIGVLGTWFGDKANKEKAHTLRAKFGNYIDSHFSFEQFVSAITGEDSKTHLWADQVTLAADLQYRDAMLARENQVTAMLRALWPRLTVAERQRKLAALAASSEKDGGMSQLDMVHMTMLWADEDTGSRDWLTLHGFGAQVQSTMEAAMTPEAKAIRRWLAAQYDAQYDQINAVYRRLYGVNLPRVKNYAPRIVEHGGNAQEMQMGGNAQVMGDLMSGFTKRRRLDTKSPPKVLDALTAYWTNAHAVEYWRAWVEPMGDLKSVFSHYQTQAALRSGVGDQAGVALNEWLGILARRGAANANGQQFLAAISRAQADAALVGKVGTLMKQMVASYAAAAQIGVPEYTAAVRRIMSGKGAITLRQMLNSPTIQRRGRDLSPELATAVRGRGLTPGERRLDGWLQQAGSSVFDLDNAHQWMRNRLGAADAYFTTLSAAAAYDNAHQEAVRLGLTGQDLVDAATAAAERVVARTAQPETIRDKSLAEHRTGAWGRLLMPFQSANRQALALFLLAAKQGRTQDAVRAALVHWMVTGVVAQTIGNLTRTLLSTDDADDVWEWEDYARAVAIGPLVGARYLGWFIEALAPLFGGFERRQAPIPTAEAIRLARNAFTKEEFDFRALSDSMNAIGLGVGSYLPRATWVSIAANILRQARGLADTVTRTDEEVSEEQYKKDRALIREYEKELKKLEPEIPEEQKAASKEERRIRAKVQADWLRSQAGG